MSSFLSMKFNCAPNSHPIIECMGDRVSLIAVRTSSQLTYSRLSNMLCRGCSLIILPTTNLRNKNIHKERFEPGSEKGRVIFRVAVESWKRQFVTFWPLVRSPKCSDKWVDVKRMFMQSIGLIGYCFICVVGGMWLVVGKYKMVIGLLIVLSDPSVFSISLRWASVRSENEYM